MKIFISSFLYDLSISDVTLRYIFLSAILYMCLFFFIVFQFSLRFILASCFLVSTVFLSYVSLCIFSSYK